MAIKKFLKPTKGKVALTIIVYLVYSLLDFLFGYIFNPIVACTQIAVSCPAGSDFWEAKLGPGCQSICTYEEYFLVSFISLFSNLLLPLTIIYLLVSLVMSGISFYKEK